jgi:hypothetical protein
MIKQNKTKPRNPVARDLRTAKYRMRVVENKLAYKRKPKFENRESFEMEL